MKRSNKKGFTTVELVIVIAVIAILAAVLIPTFANLIHKANVSADTQLAKNLNTALAMDQAVNGNPGDFSDVLDALYESGFVLANLNPTADGCYFVWEKDTNQIMLVEIDGTDYKIQYKVNDPGDPDDSWHFAVKNQRLADTVTAALSNVTIEMTILNTTDLNNEINKGGTNTVYIDGSIVTDDNNVIKLDKADAVTTIDLGTNTVTGGSKNTAVNAIPIKVVAGQLTLKDGVVNATGQIIDEDGKTADIPLVASKGTYTKIDGTVFNITTSNDGYLAFHNEADLENVTINSSNCGVNLNGADVVTLKNTTIKANYCFFVSNWNGTNHTTEHSELVIDSGNYTATNGCVLEVYSGEAVINGGTFTRANSGPLLYIYNNEFNTKITVKGGTFVSDRDGTYEYEELTVDILKKLCTTKSGELTVDITGNVTDGFVIVDKK